MPSEKSRPSPSATVDSTDAEATLWQAINHGFGLETQRRGAKYHREGRVLDLVREDDHTVIAHVRGSRTYEVELERSPGSWLSYCTCPVGENCKHVVAAMLAWRERLLSSAADDPAPVGQARPSAVRQLTFREEIEPVLVEKLGRKLSPSEGTLLGKVGQVFHNLRQSGGSVFAQDLARLGFPSQEATRTYYERAFSGWWQTPPASALELWQYIAFDLESSGLAVPPFMRPVTDTSHVRAAMHERMRRQTIARWQDRFSAIERQTHAAEAAPARELAVEPLQARVRIGASQWAFETRPKDEASWTTAPRAFLERLLRGGTATIMEFDASPATYALLAICQQEYQRFHALRFSRDDPQARAVVHRLLSHRLARTLAVDSEGRPLVFSSDRLVWNLAPAPADERDYVLSLQLPDGSPLPPSAVHLPGSPSYYLHDGVVYLGPPPLDGGSAAAAIVPAEAIEDPSTLSMLRHLGTRLPQEIEARFVEVPLRPRIECALGADFSDNEVLTLKLSAVSDPPHHENAEWLPRGWTEIIDDRDAPSPTGAIHTFDFRAANRAVRHLIDLKLVFDPQAELWTRRVTRTFPEEFLAWREQLPAEIEVVADGELATLLGQPVLARVDLSLIESEVHRDWFDLALALKPDDSTLTPEEIALLLRARGKLVRIPGKGWRRLRVQIEGAPAAALEAAGFDSETIAEAALAGEKHRFHALQLAQTAIADLLPEKEAEILRSRAHALARPDPPPVPTSLRAELRPYQKDGFEFLAFLAANRLGGVLADDMGLGKTVQTLAWLLWLAGRQSPTEPLRVLVVCPKSVVGNWVSETAKFAPSLATQRFVSGEAAAPAGVAQPTLTIANYTQLRIAADYFTRQNWHVVILDEGQFIKTPTSKVAQVARALRAELRLILTGTPIENRLTDLWSLFAFALPGLLGTQAAFKRHYAQDNPLALARLRTRVRHFLLRRAKAQVATDLPARTEEDVFVELEGEQRKLYDAELKRARAALLKVATAREFDQARFNILASLLRLRQICCHPALIDPAQHAAPAAKLEELLERVEELRDEGHQVLVFSQFVSMLELIQAKLVAAGIEHLLLTGQTENREELVREFQGDKSKTVFLLSLKAAGFGLNLTAASYVILYDPWWNPAVEAQAIDRTHRIGQTVPVNAYRLIARGTVEEKIRALQKEKSALAGAIVQEESLASVLDLDSLRRILG